MEISDNPKLLWNDAPFENEAHNTRRKYETARRFPINEIIAIERGYSKARSASDEPQRYLSIIYKENDSKKSLVLKLGDMSTREWLWARLSRLREGVQLFSTFETSVLPRLLYEYVDLYRHKESVLASWRSRKGHQHQLSEHMKCCLSPRREAKKTEKDR